MTPLLLLLLACAARAAAEQSCRDGVCDEEDDEGADKYSQERNKPTNLKDQMAMLQGALMSLLKDPHNPDVLRSSLAELALFAETPEGQRFLDQFSGVIAGEGGGATGAMVRQLFTSVLSGRVDVGKLMKDGISAGSLASLAGGLLGKGGGDTDKGSGMTTESLIPILQTFLKVIKDEQASPFLLDRLNEVFLESMPEKQLKQFERTAAGVLGGIRAASAPDDSAFVYDESALETFESFLQDFVDEQEWDWSKTGPIFMREVKKVMRMFTGSEDQIGRLMPSVMEAVADAKPSAAELADIIDNFGGVLGNVVKKDNAEPEFVNLLLNKLKTPLPQAKAEAVKEGILTEDPNAKATKETKKEEEEEVKQAEVKKDEEEAEKESDLPSMEEVDAAIKKAEGAFGNVPDLSKVAASLGALSSDPMAMQMIMMKLAAAGGGGGLNLQTLQSALPEVEGLDEITNYLTQIQGSKDEREIAGHFHSVMDAVGDAFGLLKSEDVRRTAIEQAMPYIRTAHDFLKEPLAVLKIQMGVTSLASMYETSVPHLLEMAAPHVDDTLAGLGVDLDFKEFCDDAHKFALKVHNEVYQSPKSALKKLSGRKEEKYIIDTVDHSVGEPLVQAYVAYRHIRGQPECLLQTLCRANREARQTDAGKYGVRSNFIKGATRLFGMLLASAEHDLDSVVHTQVSEAINEGQGEGNCEKLYPAECDDDAQDSEILF